MPVLSVGGRWLWQSRFGFVLQLVVYQVPLRITSIKTLGAPRWSRRSYLPPQWSLLLFVDILGVGGRRWHWLKHGYREGAIPIYTEAPSLSAQKMSYRCESGGSATPWSESLWKQRLKFFSMLHQFVHGKHAAFWEELGTFFLYKFYISVHTRMQRETRVFMYSWVSI